VWHGARLPTPSGPSRSGRSRSRVKPPRMTQALCVGEGRGLGSGGSEALTAKCRGYRPRGQPREGQRPVAARGTRCSPFAR
jgi:hypothetical protein